VIGRRGSGKTLFIMLLVLIFSESPVYSNFKLKSEKYNRFRLKFLHELPLHVNLGLDEIYALFDARSSMSHVNNAGSYLAFQLRKTDTNIYLSTTQFDSAEKRFREEYDYLVECERVPNESGDDWHYWDFLYKITESRTGMEVLKLVSYVDVEPYFKYFDTNELIPPRGISRQNYELLKQDDPYEFLEEGIRITKKILSDLKTMTLPDIKYCLQLHGEDEIWANECNIVLVRMGKKKSK